MGAPPRGGWQQATDVIAAVRKARAIIYIRVSTEREEMQSPEQQLYSCEQFAANNNINVIDVVEDLDLSGRSFAKRQIASIIERVRSGEADVVLVWKWSRFGRNNAQSQINLRELEKAGGKLIAATENFDTDTYHGRFSRDQMLLVSDLQSGIIGATWMEAHDRRHRAGLPHTGQARFGYKRCPDCQRKPDAPDSFLSCKTCFGVLQLDDKRDWALAEAYERYVDGEAGSAIAADMAAKGVRSLSGSMMKSPAWLMVMDSGFGLGWIRWRSPDFRRRYGRSSKSPSTYDNWARGKHKPVVPEDRAEKLWEAYKRRREGKSGIAWSTTAKYAYSGLLRCWAVNHEGKICGKRMTANAVVRKSANATRIFRCPDIDIKACPGLTISLARVDAEILKWLEREASGEGMGVAAMQSKARQERAASDIRQVETELRQKEQEKKRLLDLYLKELVSEDDFMDKKEEIEAEIELFKSRKSVLSEALGGNLIPAPEEFGSLLKIWGRMTPDKQRAALQQVIDRIEVVKTEGKKYNLIRVVPKWDAALEDQAA